MDILSHMPDLNQNPPKQRQKENKQKNISSLSLNSIIEKIPDKNNKNINIVTKREGKLEKTIWVIYNAFNEEWSLIIDMIRSPNVK